MTCLRTSAIPTVGAQHISPMRVFSKENKLHTKTEKSVIFIIIITIYIISHSQEFSRIVSSTHVINEVTFVYTPGALASAHPSPKDVTPITV